ncbi:efflux RND transporter periplasmic adaptor subunit [Sediminispirochaeta bajacaliforniensis]|uniref:efflux RND transporter periplasmic adaptor subunit n=1 Tax=Sediminispirochaeta bajacaliforniensis TaxID=148 RepID=UPI000368E161|nr:efflux RND transporter periplasmic adaptor subunit [Sediminispirochaeta bajacaliforniensis]
MNRKTVSGKAGIAGLLLMLFALLFVTGCDKLPGRGNKDDTAKAGSEKAAAEEDKSETIFAVSATESVTGQIYNYLNVNGDVVSKTTVDTYPDVAGKLSRILVEVGDTVRKNQVIAEVDPSKPGMNYAASPVKAAITGTITSIPEEVGSMVSQQSPIVRISRMDELQIETYVAERFISRMKVGQRALVSLDAFPGKTFMAKVIELSPLVDASSRTMDLKLDFVGSADGVRAGMFAKIKIITEDKEGVVKIPSAGVIERFGEDYVFVIKDESSVEKRKVTAGIEIDGKQEILEGLSGGETIVIRGQTLLEDGSLVKVVQKVEPLPVKDSID